MDMSSMTMTSEVTSTGTMAMPTGSSSAAGGGMSMGGGCKISMTWNWTTIDACFISRSWHITSAGMFAGSCIGVILLVISLEFLRRVQREYDAYLRRVDRRATGPVQSSPPSSETENEKSKTASPVTRAILGDATQRPHINPIILVQRQLIRALIHMFQFGVAYFVMLLAMYYNGYIIICIFIGAFLGSFIFTWDQLLEEFKRNRQPPDVTGCCG
ncbi:hypothetical protein PV10_08296 [Exophiala mesophila]|uniref:Copper transport protein n=2 Tax=Exophiala mesophila TaxID=212818 RepID=A0A0D1Z401_EXOME|nr:uncharacterized protein PV10_08296 [Exophiala mesophila]KIV88629.1 hypothetical protein PV10_08296 [Exophiala mesophila]